MAHFNATFIEYLLAKNVPFCLYRYPSEKAPQLALEKTYLPHPAHTCFWIVPFSGASAAKEIMLFKVNNDVASDQIMQNLAALPDTPLQWQELPLHTSREDYLSRAALFLQNIRSGKLQKAILSRVKKIEKPEDFNPYAVFQHLCDQYPQAFVHLVYHHEGGMWLGATPELLLTRDKESFSTMALAGTQPINESHQYTWDSKEQKEQHMVEQHIEAVFEQHHCRLKIKNGPKTVEAGQVAHLRTEYDYIENHPIALKQLLHDLHPTPAVGGLPAAEGVKFILQNEGYDRGYYCGFLGETNFVDDVHFFTNLRCMQIGKDEIALYVGSGLTADSDPEAEWEETVQKSLTMLNVMKEMNKNEIV